MFTPATSEKIWIDCLRLVPEWVPAAKSTVVVAPHPDDETLAAGGLIATQRAREIPVLLLAVTDGEAAYPGVSGLAEVRRIEQLKAAEALGIPGDGIIRLGLPDSAVSYSQAALATTIESYIDADTLLIAPWPGDPHPDHEACGKAAAIAAGRTGANLIYYFFWTWHRFLPSRLSDLPLRRLSLSLDASSRREKALSCHQSQLHRADGPPILPEILLSPARRPFEIFCIYGD